MMVGNNNTVTTALIDFYCNGTKQYVGYGCSLSHYYLIKGDTTQYRTYTEALNASVEKGYLTKGNVKNFVCFGSTEIPCPDANSFRIIGVFGDQVKVIRAKSVGIMQWDNSGILELGSYGSNTWSTSSLNTYLNGEYLTGLATLAENIASTTWKVGGNTWENIGNQPVKTAYQNEIVSPVTTNTTDGATEYSAKIGLMYVSDYGYAASPSAWTTTLDHYDSSSITSVNWMYMELYEWTISRYADDSGVAFEINQSGEITANPVDSHLEIRPSFYLLPSITYVSGEGTLNSPIIIN